MIRITADIAIDERELHEEFVRASGPGGQNVNKVSTAVQLRFDVVGSPSLPAEVRQRLISLAGRRVSRRGVLLIDAQRFRTQEANRKDALERLAAIIRLAAERPKPRRKTRPSLGSKTRRLQTKHRRGDIKRMRHAPGTDE